MSKPTFYEILGIANDATETEIKKAYRSLSLKYHPDRNPSDEAKSKIQEINEAYEILSDQGNRANYDMELKFGNGNGGMHFNGAPGQEEFVDISNIFNMMFGGGMGGMGGMPGMHGMPGMGGMPGIRIFQGGPGHTQIFHQFQHVQRPEPIQINVQITMEQSYAGCTVPIEINRVNIKNNVKIAETELIHINIPQGLNNNETVILHDKGNVVNDTIKGEVRICIIVTNNTEFTRVGLDLVSKKTISLKEALCGFSVEVQHLNGKRMCLNNTNNPTVIKPNFNKVIPSLGMIRENSTGNMIIEFTVEFPASLTKEQMDAISNIL